MAIATLTIAAIISIVIGILILFMPKLLNYFVAAWLILSGLLQIISVYGGY